MIKLAFIALFVETREALTSRWRSVLYFTAVTIAATFIIVIWTISKDII